MDFVSELEKAHSKQNTIRIAAAIGNSPTLFSQLLTTLQTEDLTTLQRGVWVLREVLSQTPSLLNANCVTIMLQLLEENRHPAVARNILGVFQDHPIQLDEAQLGVLVDLAFQFLNNAKQPVAIQVHAMSVLAQACTTFPELASELQYSIKSQLPFASAGFKSRAKKTLVLLEKMPKG